MANMAVEEIGVAPGDDSAFQRESYSLAAGLALGLITLGCGNRKHALLDLGIEDRLIAYIEGKPKRPNHAARSAPKQHQSKSAITLEPEGGNVNLTAPGATIALALMHLKV
jgi:anaphase-promoting complex subunit 1